MPSRLETLELGVNYADALAKKAGGLFIWSATVFKFLEQCFDPNDMLVKLINDGGSPLEPLRQLYLLYDTVHTFYGRSEYDLKIMHRVLGIVYITSTTTPVPISAITLLLRADPAFERMGSDVVERVIRALHAVLYEEKDSGAIRAYHPSFLDYLSDQLGQDGWESVARVHWVMFDRSFSVMLSKLKINICGLKDGTLPRGPSRSTSLLRVIRGRLECMFQQGGV